MRTLKNTIQTGIWMEEESDGNPFYPEKSYLHGYDFYGELLGCRNWMELTFLHLTGELPGDKELVRFNLLFTAVMNPGPRDLQNRAAMTAAIGGCNVGGSLMAGFASSQGAAQGGLAVENCMKMLTDIVNGHKKVSSVALAAEYDDGRQVPGFGRHYGQKDSQAIRLLELLDLQEKRGPALTQLTSMEKTVTADGFGYLRTYGLFAAGLLDLGLSPVQGHGLYMVASSVGMLSFLCERYDQHWSEYPTWFSDAEYHFKAGVPS